MAEEKAPPALPGEVWRGTVNCDGATWDVAVASDTRAHLCVGGRWVDMTGASCWEPRILRAYAEAMRVRAERAEAIAAAWANLWHADRALVCALGSAGHAEIDAALSAAVASKDALRALGVKP